MKKLLVTTICLLGAHLLSAGEIWISPQGNDFNDGTRPSPKATLTSALRQAREWRRTDDERGRGGITICMEGGTYALYEPVFIRPEDSGTEDSPTVIRPVADEKVVLSGGIRIGGWKKQGKLWVADVPMFNGRPLDFRQLWVNGKKAVRARDVEDFEKMNCICSVDEKNEILYVPAVAIRRLVDGKGALKAKYAEMVLHQMWCVANLRIRSVELAGDSAAIRFHQPESRIQFEHLWPRPMVTTDGHNSAFYLTNARELLDVAGEWYHDIDARKVYYYPRVLPSVTTRSDNTSAPFKLSSNPGKQTAFFPSSNPNFPNILGAAQIAAIRFPSAQCFLINSRSPVCSKYDLCPGPPGINKTSESLKFTSSNNASASTVMN